MPEANSQAAQPGGASAQVAEGQQAAQQAAAPAAPQTEAPLTREDVARLIEQQTARLIQSQVAKSENRITAKIQGQLKSLQDLRAPLGLTDQQVADAKARIITDAYAEPEPPTAASQQQPEAETLHPLAAIAFPVFEKEGVTIQEGDPEFARLKPYLDLPKPTPLQVAEFAREVFSQVAAKKERTTSAQQQAPLRAPTGGPQTPPGPKQYASAREMWQDAHKPKS